VAAADELLTHGGGGGWRGGFGVGVCALVEGM
jgi:hypothetical protein